jgi:4-amino-4-deoxy-L-arabinose transferase-like glycosyltransferase
MANETRGLSKKGLRIRNRVVSARAVMLTALFGLAPGVIMLILNVITQWQYVLLTVPVMGISVMLFGVALVRISKNTPTTRNDIILPIVVGLPGVGALLMFKLHPYEAVPASSSDIVITVLVTGVTVGLVIYGASSKGRAPVSIDI